MTDGTFKTLIWKNDGYQISTAANWHGYENMKTGLILAHDVFEHQNEDTDGLEWREIRTLGADFHFRKRLMSQFAFNSLFGLGGSRVKLPAEIQEFPEIELPEEMIIHYTILFGGSSNKEAFFNLLKGGLVYGQQFTLEAFNTLAATDFFALHRTNNDLRVDLATGKVSPCFKLRQK
jgi:hypothetical protein